MSTSDLYHMQGCKGWTQVPGTKYGKRGTIFKIVPQPRMLKCPVCGSPNVTRKGSVIREFLGSQVGTSEPVILQAEIPTVKCKKCNARRQIDTGIAVPKKTYTKSFSRDALTLVRLMPVLAVARLFRVGWNMVGGILKSYLEKKYPKKLCKHLISFAVDEIYFGKGRKAMTVVFALDSQEPVFVGDGRAAKALDPFWEMLGPRRCKKVRCVAMDMGAAYQAAVREHCPNAVIVFDHFHVVKLANDYVDKLRRVEMAKCAAVDRRVMKGSRFLLLKNPENLDDARKERQRLDRLLELNQPLYKMYVLKEALRLFWTMGSREEADTQIEAWIRDALSSGVPLILRWDAPSGGTRKAY